MSQARHALPTPEQEASDTFVRRLHGELTRTEEAAFKARLASDEVFSAAWQRVEASWTALDTHAETPELMAYRAEAITCARRAGARRWTGSTPRAQRRWRLLVAAVFVAVACGVAWQVSPYGYRSGLYRTGIGEQRIVELDDHSHLALDAATRVRVRYSDDARIVQLLGGQAQFSVAKDPTRPFKVQAGDRTIVALGTVFTVEYADRKVHVAMMEGKVAVVPSRQAVYAPERVAPAPDTVTTPRREPQAEVKQRDARYGGTSIELIAGEELHVSQDGSSIITPKADLEAATAWREGKVIFRTEPLGQAVSRMNRYSRVQLRIDDAQLAAKHISGVFEAGDTQGFVLALQRYMPSITVESSDSDTLRLRMR